MALDLCLHSFVKGSRKSSFQYLAQEAFGLSLMLL